MERYKGEVSLLIVTVLWGLGFPATSIALKSASPYFIMFLRFFAGSIVLSLVFFKSLKNIDKNSLKAGLFNGFFLFLGFILQTIGMEHTTSSKSSFLTATNVVIVPIIAFIIKKNKIDIFSVIGAFVTFLGAIVLSFNFDFTVNFGDILTLFCAFAFAMQIYFTGHFLEKGVDAVSLTITQLWTASFFSFLSIFLVKNEPLTSFNMEFFITIFYLSVISIPITYLLQTVSQKHIKSQTRVAVIMSLESVFGTLFSVIILNELLSFRIILGSIIIFSGVIIAECGYFVSNFFVKE